DTLYLTPDSFGTRRDNYWEGPGNIHIVIALLEIKRDNNDLFSVFAIMKILAGFRLLLLGCWLGAAIFFVVVAQNVFAAMPTHEAAGNLISRIIAILNYSGLGIAFIV